MKCSFRQFPLLVVCLTATLSPAQSSTGQQAREAAAQRLQAATGGAVVMSPHKSTGAKRFVRIRPGSGASLGTGAATSVAAKQQQSLNFFRNYGALIGVAEPSSMQLVSSVVDRVGETHLTWKQSYMGVPVFAATLKTHFDASQRLKAVSGTAIPDISLNPVPTANRAAAEATALASVVAERGGSDTLHTGSVTLYVYREGLAQGVPGINHLAWEIEVTDGAGIRDFVYIDAHNGKFIDRITAIQDDLYRRAYDGHNLPFAPQNYPSGTYWTEGETFPTASTEANNMITASQETYNFFSNAFGRDSFNGTGGIMDAIFDRGYDCPNASWNGTFISFCPGTTADDVTAHEWGHAYTQYTHDLIYAWQPGALNESYSDIWGETVDRINGRGTDSPFGARTANVCSTFSPPVAQLRVNAPPAIAGNYFAQAAAFGPALNSTGITGDAVAALDAADAAGPSTLDGCSALTNAAEVSGKIALVDRGTCQFTIKVLNAQAAGAIGVIVANNAATGLAPMGAGDRAAEVTIPSIGVQQSTGSSIRAQLGANTAVNVTMVAQPGTDASYRWLIGEDSSAFNGAIRDMSNPSCYGNPGKVSDTAYYACGAGDGGGVHTNSGVPNHGYALLVDGGTYNGQTISGVGLTKAAHIYFRAMEVYQVQDSDFADHADALEQSCQDLKGVALNALTGGASSEVITDSDCAQVSATIAAVELRTPTTFCNFPKLLDPRLPAQCSASTTTGVKQSIRLFDFESAPSDWTASHIAATADFTPRDWAYVTSLPSGRSGAGFFAPDPQIGTCAPGGDESGVLHLTSPPIALPSDSAFARATFDHWVATEPGFDGGNLKISVNNGAWQLVPPSEFTFNNYSAFLVGAPDNTNPLAGQPAWTGTNPGTVSDGSWGQSQVNLGNFAAPGNSIRLRWDLGTDGCAGRHGWYLDNVEVYSCTPKVPAITVSDVTVVEGNAGRRNVLVTILLSAPTIVPVTVNYTTLDGTAIHGNDFDRVAGTAVIPASTATTLRGGVQVAIPIKGDIVPEPDEFFFLKLSSPRNATLGNDQAKITIANDDSTPTP